MEKAESIVFGEHSMPYWILFFSLRSCSVFADADGVYGHHGHHRFEIYIDLLVCFGHEVLQLVRLLFPMLVLHSTICLPRAVVGVLAVASLSGLCCFDCS